MGQKISVNLFRAKSKLANANTKQADIIATPNSVWYADDQSYSTILLQDVKIREFLENKLKGTGLAKLEIKRFFKRIEIYIHTSKPGLVIGRGGSLIDALKTDLLKKFKLPTDTKLIIEEFRDPNRSASVIAEDIAYALNKRVPFRKVAKNYLEKIKYSGILGAKIVIKGRLNGADIARKEEFSFGSIPRHTIDSQIDYAINHCNTFAGIVGIKVYLYKGDKITNYSG